MTSCSRTSASSSVVRGRSLIACWSEGVRISLCESRAERPSFWCSAKAYPPRATRRSGLPAVQAKTLPKIDPSHLGVRGELRGSTGAEDITVPQNIGPIRYFQGLAHVVVGDEDADPAVPQVR